jgi:hypothetical protein
MGGRCRRLGVELGGVLWLAYLFWGVLMILLMRAPNACAGWGSAFRCLVVLLYA